MRKREKESLYDLIGGTDTPNHFHNVESKSMLVGCSDIGAENQREPLRWALLVFLTEYPDDTLVNMWTF